MKTQLGIDILLTKDDGNYYQIVSTYYLFPKINVISRNQITFINVSEDKAKQTIEELGLTKFDNPDAIRWKYHLQCKMEKMAKKSIKNLKKNMLPQ